MIKKNKKIKLRYGENPNQKSYLLHNKSNSVFKFQISGKDISYNNIIDVDSGLECLNEFNDATCVIVKHTNPCGVAASNNILNLFKKAFSSNSKSAFGGVVLLNRKVTFQLADLLNKFFFEIIVAPNFEDKAVKKLSEKKNLILLKIPKIKKNITEVKSTIFGDLYQEKNLSVISRNFIKLVSKKKTSSKRIEDIIFALKVVKHLKSNSIVLACNKQTLGIGQGQTNRVDALNYAIKNMKNSFNLKNYVCASDGFFPFTDSINILRRNGCRVVAQPSGSINDIKIINYAIKNNLSLYFIKNRLFKH